MMRLDGWIHFAIEIFELVTLGILSYFLIKLMRMAQKSNEELKKNKKDK
jgi:hypothetical protein